jgi:hypothetical protein
MDPQWAASRSGGCTHLVFCFQYAHIPAQINVNVIHTNVILTRIKKRKEEWSKIGLVYLCLMLKISPPLNIYFVNKQI